MKETKKKKKIEKNKKKTPPPPPPHESVALQHISVHIVTEKEALAELTPEIWLPVLASSNRSCDGCVSLRIHGNEEKHAVADMAALADADVLLVSEVSTPA